MRSAAVAVFLLFCFAIRMGPAHAVEPGEQIFVELEPGRRVAGEFAGMDARGRLWLIHREAGIELRSGYGLNRITRILVQGKPISLAAFRDDKTPPAPPWRIPLQDPPLSSAQNGPPLGPVLPPVTLEAAAEPANWDDDAEIDGLRVYLTPRDAFRRPVPVNGQLSAVLVSGTVRPGQLFASDDPLLAAELQRWGRPIRSQMPGPAGVVIDLPFDGRRRMNLRNLGLPLVLKVRLGIPGRNVLSAVALVPLPGF